MTSLAESPFKVKRRQISLKTLVFGGSRALKLHKTRERRLYELCFGQFCVSQ
jgi:hypothetical protein